MIFGNEQLDWIGSPNSLIKSNKAEAKNMGNWTEEPIMHKDITLQMKAIYENVGFLAHKRAQLSKWLCLV